MTKSKKAKMTNLEKKRKLRATPKDTPYSS